MPQVEPVSMPQVKPVSTPQVKRVVIGVGPGKKSAAIHHDSPNHQEVPGIFWRSTLWAATELPVNNQTGGDRGADVTIREPYENGLIFRAPEIPPDIKDAKKHIEILQELNKKVKQKYPPTEKDLERHPSMHRTDTCDMFMVAYGEIYLVSDTDETLLQAITRRGLPHGSMPKYERPHASMQMRRYRLQLGTVAAAS